MRAAIFKCLLAFAMATAAVTAVDAGERMGELPPDPVARSWAGPAGELYGRLVFDPQLIEGVRLPPGMRLRTLDDQTGERSKAYLAMHPERRNWVISFYELIGIANARYDGQQARFDRGSAGRGGMTVWYINLVPVSAPDARALGEHYLVYGSWISDPHLARYMRSRGFPAADSKLTYLRAADAVSAAFEASDLEIAGGCRLEGAPYLPGWAQEPVSYQTMWTSPAIAATFEVVTWSHHRAIACRDAHVRVSGTHPFARAFNDRAVGDPNVYPVEFFDGYMLRSGLYRLRQER